MTVVIVGSALARLALFVGGALVALMLRRRDARAALLTALGFGCVLLSTMIAFSEGFVMSRIMNASPGSAQVQTALLLFGVVTTFVRLAGLLLIFLGLLRAVRRRAPVSAPVSPGAGPGSEGAR